MVPKGQWEGGTVSANVSFHGGSHPLKDVTLLRLSLSLPCPLTIQTRAPRCCSRGSLPSRPSSSSSSSSSWCCSLTGSGISGGAGWIGAGAGGCWPVENCVEGCRGLGTGLSPGTVQPLSPHAGRRTTTRRPWRLTGTTARVLQGGTGTPHTGARIPSRVATFWRCHGGCMPLAWPEAAVPWCPSCPWHGRGADAVPS